MVTDMVTGTTKRHFLIYVHTRRTKPCTKGTIILPTEKLEANYTFYLFKVP
jgi:hypothetical protein